MKMFKYSVAALAVMAAANGAMAAETATVDVSATFAKAETTVAATRAMNFGTIEISDTINQAATAVLATDGTVTVSGAGASRVIRMTGAEAGVVSITGTSRTGFTPNVSVKCSAAASIDLTHTDGSATLALTTVRMEVGGAAQACGATQQAATAVRVSNFSGSADVNLGGTLSLNTAKAGAYSANDVITVSAVYVD